MLRNYLKMALKVLNRRRFYTFISMFGITLTLAILMIVASFWEHLVGVQGPEVNQERSLLIVNMRMKGKAGFTISSTNSIHYLEEYVSKLQTPENMSFYSIAFAVSTFIDGQKVSMDRKFTDANFWQVMQHKFTEGRSYTAEEVAQRQPVVVIARSLKEDLFGQASAVGKELKVGEDRFKVIGVIEDTPVTRIHSYGTLYVPITLDKKYGIDKSFTGEYMATLVAKDKASVQAMQQEYKALVSQIENPDPSQYESFSTNADPYLAAFSRMILGDADDSGINTLYTVLFVLAFLFMLLPTVNLMNINISRIMERASEIGVRKAFGASSFALIIQFIVENLVLTLLSGVLAFVVAWVALQAINSASIIDHMELSINMEVLWAGLIFTILFGLLSGVYPAWRMSRLHPAEALKTK
ncbi:ABC transporter permease [Cesiribacter sp. SM1]|uniref:ABC transporter permease n=1 Tax=Cesiribacter sp. SM1 TaxID=2861196 RepID=UPI001CD787DF|nr:ABC transporter permease [Cesiribacter sp. SM1]